MNQISDVAEAVKNRTAGLLETMEDTGYSSGSETLVVDEYVNQVVISKTHDSLTGPMAKGIDELADEDDVHATLTTLEKLVEEFGKYAYEHAIKLAVAATMCGDEKGAEHYAEIARRLLKTKP